MGNSVAITFLPPNKLFLGDPYVTLRNPLGRGFDLDDSWRYLMQGQRGRWWIGVTRADIRNFNLQFNRVDVLPSDLKYFGRWRSNIGINGQIMTRYGGTCTTNVDLHTSGSLCLQCLLDFWRFDNNNSYVDLNFCWLDDREGVVPEEGDGEVWPEIYISDAGWRRIEALW